MRREVAAALVAVAVAASAGTAWSATPAQTVHALVWQGQTVSLAALDARSLAPRGGLLALGRAQGSVSTDRLGDRLAVASAGVGVAVVDTRAMKVVWRLDRGRLIRAVSWLSPSRLLVVEHGGVLLLDPVRRRIVSRADFDGVVLASAKWAQGLVVLAFRNEGSIEPARVFAIGPGTRVRAVELSRIAAGWASGTPSTAEPSFAQPGLAVDVAGGRAFVAGGPHLATIDLASLGISYGADERALQKLTTGPRRSAAWLGDGILAVAGADERLSGTVPTNVPLGLRYVTPAGVRMVDQRATQVSVASGLALAYGHRYTDGRYEGMGLAAYDRAGVLRWQLFGDAPVGSVAVVNGLAYVSTSGPVNVVELATGTLLSRSGPRWRTMLVLG